MITDKTIGIITFHRAANYGAMLQAFALKTALMSLGFANSNVIDYRAPSIERIYKYRWSFCFHNASLSFKGLKNIIGRLIYGYILTKRLHNFRKFERNYIASSSDNFKKYDVIVFGSDQIWNVGITDNDDTYFGNIGTDRANKISYAGSLGHGDVTAFQSKKRLLSQFKAIGVRETKLVSILSEIGLESFVCLDPTLLLNREIWLNHLNLSTEKKDDSFSLLVYCIRDKERTLKAAKKIAAQLRVKLVVLDAGETVDAHGVNSKTSYYGPREFVRCFNEASYVVTDSFHGTAFSIIFQKPFVSCCLGDGRDGRSESLLSQLGLLSQLKEPEKMTAKSFGNIDYRLVNKELNKLRSVSLKHLYSSVTLD